VLMSETEEMIREAWAAAPSYINVVAENEREDDILFSVYDLIESLGYDD
jgi:hypothetical protein